MTGSHGFVGSNLIEALSGEHEILRWDARADRTLPDADAVIHLAGLAHDTSHTTEAEKYYEVNTELTKKIYDRFLESTAKIFIFFSSIKAQDGDTAYAVSKREAELAISQKEEFRRKRGKKVYILRPCMIHGPGNKGNLNLLVKWVKKGMPWPLAAFENKRSFASIGNVCFIVNRLLGSDVESGTYNICDDELVSTNKLVSVICDCMGKKARLWKIPRGLVGLGAKVGDLVHLPLNSERLAKLTENYVVDNTKIKEAFGIKMMPIRALDGLKSTIRFMINQQ